MSARRVKQYKFLTPKKDRHYSVTDNQSHMQVEQKLNKREDLIDKYQTEIDQLVSQINTKQRVQTIQPRALLNKQSRIRSSTKAEPSNYSLAIQNPLTDYKKIILGLQYSLQNEKKLTSDLERKNRSLESEVSNLRNLVVRPTDNTSEASSEPGSIQAYRDRVTQLEQQVHDMKLKSVQVYEIKSEAINALERENRALRSEFDTDNDKGLMKKVNELVNLNEELRNAIYRKNLKIQQMKFGRENDPEDKSVSSDDDEKDEATKSQDVNLLLKKIDMMSKQFDVANQLILRKNTELLQIAKSKRTNQDVIAIIDDLLDKKQVGNSELLSHPVVNKVRIFLRQRVLFQKQLFQKLTFHNKKIQILQQQLRNKDSKLEGHSSSLEQQCREMSRNIASLQKQLIAYERDLAEKKNEVEIVRNDYAIEKKNFVMKMREMSQELNGIISTTQQEFEKQKLENLKLAEQNRSLLFLVGTKEKELSDKGAAIRTFEKYKQTINNIPLSSMNIQGSPSRIDTKLRSQVSAADLHQDISKPTKLLMISTFSNWLLEWNKLRNWKNRKSLLNILLDKQDLKDDAYSNCLNNLISVIHQCFFNSKNLQIQQRAAVLVSAFLEKGILKNKNVYVSRIAPYIIRCFRAKNQGQDQQQHRIYNQAALSFTDQLDKSQLQWTYQMTNEMIAVNGFKYVFSVITQDKNDDLIQKAYNTLAVISRKNQMINFMISYNITDVLLKNLDSNYRFISHVLYLLDTLLDSDEYVRASAKYLLEFRALFQLLLDDDPEVLEEVLKCLMKICRQSGFTRGINKKEVFPKVLALLEKSSNFEVLKQAGKLFILLVNQIDVTDHDKLAKKEIMSLLDIVHKNQPMSPRFSRATRLILKSLRIVSNFDADVATFAQFTSVMDDNFDRIDEKTRKKMIETVNMINERNRNFLEKNVTDDVLAKFVKGYLSMKPTYTVELIFFLTMMKNMHELKKTVDILKLGRESLVNKLLEDSQQVDYGVSIGSLKNFLSISKEKFSEKFITPQNCLKILKYACKDKTQQEYISLCLSILYFLSKVQTNSDTLVQNNLVQKMCDLLIQRNALQNVVFKILAVLQLNNTTQYKKRILNYIIGGDKKLMFLKTLNHCLRKSKNKVELGSRALFVYDFLNGQQQIDSMATVVEANDWMVEDLVKVRNDYVGVLEPVVFKIELLLHEMSKLSKKVKKAYQQFVVERDEELDD